MAESAQHKLDRVRRPRVHITYDVETGGAMKAVELPFVVGVLADLSAQPKEALKPLKERKAVFIDRDNFNKVLAQSGARLALRVPNKLTDPNSKLAVELNFKNMDDFGPARVAEQIGPLKQLLDMRHELTQLLNRMEGNDKLEQLLADVLNEGRQHPDVHRLEGSWRGLHYLVHQSETGELLKIRVLNVTRKDLFRDLERAAEFDQSALFKMIYEEEYGMLGGKPYGML